jgi:hypothetical protein
MIQFHFIYIEITAKLVIYISYNMWKIVQKFDCSLSAQC